MHGGVKGAPEGLRRKHHIYYKILAVIHPIQNISFAHINHFKEIMGVDEIIHNGIVAVNEDICLCIGVEEAYGESIRPVRQSNIL